MPDEWPDDSDCKNFAEVRLKRHRKRGQLQISGLFGIVAVLVALADRDRTGLGCKSSSQYDMCREKGGVA
jgi:hypothetical protein